MTRIVRLTVVAVLLAPALLAAPLSADAEKLWSLEKAYWQYVQANDLQKYRTLWRTDFLGWPYVSPEPLRRDHITDWITAQTSKGESLQSYDLKRLTSQVTGDVATTTYRVRLAGGDKAGAGQSSTIRVIHTWVRDANGTWQIISGMSAPTNADGH
jgi:ketosteroid isomerase-like protein